LIHLNVVTDTKRLTSPRAASVAGIAFLWFVGVVRDRLGSSEDRFVATILLGSSLLLLAMVFVASAIAGALLALNRPGSGSSLDPAIADFGRAPMLQISNIYALRMAGVLMISLATLWSRTGVMPRWLGALTYLLALMLLLIISFNLWVTLVFPTWVMGVSVYFLFTYPGSGQPRTGNDR
jgi:hypothetical protein